MRFRTAIILGAILSGGASSAVFAQCDTRDVVRDTEGQIVHATNGTCVRTRWLVGDDPCAPPPPPVPQPPPLAPAAALTLEQRTVYFEFDRSNLTMEARQKLDTLSDILKSDQSVKEANIVGYADRIGSISYNCRLSQKRAETVRNYLVSRGYLNAHVVETRWVGKSEPTADCPNRTKDRRKLIECLQPDRRVEVEIIFNPPPPAVEPNVQ